MVNHHFLPPFGGTCFYFSQPPQANPSSSNGTWPSTWEQKLFYQHPQPHTPSTKIQANLKSYLIKSQGKHPALTSIQKSSSFRCFRGSSWNTPFLGRLLSSSQCLSLRFLRWGRDPRRPTRRRKRRWPARSRGSPEAATKTRSLRCRVSQKVAPWKLKTLKKLGRFAQKKIDGWEGDDFCKNREIYLKKLHSWILLKKMVAWLLYVSYPKWWTLDVQMGSVLNATYQLNMIDIPS